MYMNRLTTWVDRVILQVKETSYSRLCKNKTLLTVNGQFPGPTITARRGEWVFVNVHNQGDKNITIHW
jgi:laccase